VKNLAFLASLAFFILFCQLSSFAQSSPNLENGFKNYGSYDSSHLDTVNLMNGNLMLHVPVLPTYPQRGNFTPQYSLYVSSKAWQVHSKRTSSTDSLPTFWWQSNSAGVMVISNTGLLIRRSLLKTFAGNAQTFYNTQTYVLTGPDSGVHKFNPVPGSPVAPNSDPTTYESVDGSGYHIVISNADANGVMSTLTVTDRNGTQYQGSFSTDYTDFQTRCMRPGIVGLPKVGNYAPFAEDIPFGDQVCPQYAFSQTAIDSNGNLISFTTTGVQTPPVPSNDTLARNMPFSFIPATPGVVDTSKCVIRGGQALAGADLVYYNAPDGTVRYLQRCYATFAIQTAFGLMANNGFNMVNVAEAPNSLGGAATATLLATLIQADGSTWIFDYDSYSNLTYVGLPTGGSIGYTWTTINVPACGSDLTSMGRAVKTRTLTDNNGHSTQWSYNWGTPGATITNTSTDPVGNATVHVFSLQSDSCSFYETTTSYFQGPASGQPLKQVDTSYSPDVIFTEDSKVGNVVPVSIKTTVNPSGKVSLVTKQYDTGFGSGSPIFGNVVKEFEYDWGPAPSGGALLRETDTTYQWQADSRYLTAHLVDLPASVVVKDGSGCAFSETDYTYDEAQYFTGTTISTQHGSAPNPAPIRGNATTVTRWAAAATSCNPKSGTAVTSHTNWYDTGEPLQRIDPIGHTTTLSYDSAYAGAYVTQTCSPQTGSVTHCVSGTYDFNTGVLTSLTNENATTQASGNTQGDDAHTTRFTYDYMFHVASAQAPPDSANSNARATTSFSYSTITTPGVFPVTITRQSPITTVLVDSATNTFDGLARPILGQHIMPSGPPSTVSTNYDDLHGALTVSNPYFSTTEATYGNTTTNSDALGRPMTVTEQDGSIKSVSYDVVPPAGTLGNCNLSTDEAGNQRRSCSDALGRLVEVDEPGAAFAGTAASGTLNIGGVLKSVSGIGAHGASAASIVLTVNGQDHIQTSIPTCPRGQICDTTPTTLLDTGTVSITINGRVYSYVFGQGTSGDTAFTVANALANSIHLGDSQADAFATNTASTSATVTLTARTAGAAGNSIGFTTSWSWDTVDFPTQGASFSFAAPTSGNLANGVDAFGGTTVWDGGTVSFAVGSYSAQVCYGVNGQCATVPPASGCVAGNSDATQVACLLAYTIRSLNPPFTISASGGLITINWSSNTQAGNVTVTATSNTIQTGYFSTPSFVGCSGTCASATSNPQAYSTATMGGQDPTGPGLGHNFYATLYQYDALGNLLCVEQHGNVSGTSCSASPASDATSPWRVRRFTYDSLSRLLTARNPESGTITYAYDADGNVLQKTSPAPNQTGASTQTISYCYDELHRIKGKAYSAQSCPLTSPVVTYAYDSGANAKGKLTSLTDQAGSASYAYDNLGRMTSETRVINGVSKSMSYDYNLDGSIKTIHYPSGAAVTYTPDSAGRVLSAVDAGNNINYITGAGYQADGQLLGFISGNAAAFAGITNTFNYNKRLQPINMSASAPSQTVFSIGYDFHLGNGTTGANNGNVWGITNYKDNTRNQSFTYDLLNRLTSAQNAGTNCAASTVNGKTEYWGNNYGYDPWGNLTSKTVTKCSAEHLSAPSLVNNQLSGYGYDAAGNMTTDPTDGGITLSYDQENRIQSTAGYTYTYDADGNRVKKINGSTGTIYWYMTPGIVAESDLSGTLKSEYVFFDGERVARRDLVAPGGVFYYFSDHLKTASVITDSLGNIKSESDYYPWGGELQFVNNDSNHYKFTGKERDAETGLDYFGARYYSNGLARFITPDWSSTPIPVPYADFGDPQSLNQYSYVRNVPTSRADVDGHCWPIGQCAHIVMDKVNQVQASLQNKAERVGPTVAAATTFTTGVTRDVINGVAGLGTVGEASGAAWNGTTTERVIAAAEDGGKVGGIILTVVAIAGPKAPAEAGSGRLPQDVGVNPKPPAANNGTGAVGPSATQNAAAEGDVAAARAAGHTDIRMNQQQVNAQGQRVGVNRPDLQSTDANGVRHYTEYDRSAQNAADHHARTTANDSNGVTHTKTGP
jgi:RHS repeat-associated protein